MKTGAAEAEARVWKLKQAGPVLVLGSIGLSHRV
jgi:hypothetical protein